MKTSFRITPRLLKQFFTTISIAILLLSSTSCSKDDMDCEENNTGVLIATNTRSKGTLKVFFNREPRSGNTPGDLNIKPGESANMDLLSGQISIFALLDLSSCNPEGTVCMRQAETLESKIVDLSACQEFNIAY